MSAASGAVVRPVRRGDLAALVGLCAAHAAFERAAFADDGLAARLAEALFTSPPRLHAWLALVDGEAVGYASASVEFSTWRGHPLLHLDCLFLHEAARGQGLGRRLLAVVAAQARRLGCEAMEWQTPAWNRDGIGFYLALGATAMDKVRFRLALPEAMPG